MRRKPSQLTCDKPLILNSSSRWTCFNTFFVNVMLTQQYIFDHLIFEAEPSFPCSLGEIATARLIRSGNSSRLSITGARTASSHSTVRRPTQGGNREAVLLGGSVSKPFVLPLILFLYRSLSLYLTLESDLYPHHQ